jgi:membrane protease YdiL (CAAX protease family)
MSQGQPRMNGFAMAIVVEGGITMLALLMAGLFGVPLRDLIPMRGEPLVSALVRGILVTVPMLAVFFLLAHWPLPSLRQLRRQVESLLDEMFPTASIPQFAMVAVLAGVGEELLFRGVLQTVIAGWTTPIVGLAIASLLFGLAHALSKLYFFLATLIGVFFGWLVLYYHDLVAPIVAHSLYDFVALIYLSRRVR